MIQIGKYNQLTVLRKTDYGFFLGDGEENSVLLPNKYCPEDGQVDDQINVFVYLDHEERIVATTLNPRIKLYEFALLKVAAVNEVGAFLDWGLEKELLVPFKEQPVKMEEGRSYIVYLNLDEETGRLYASNRIDKFLQNTDLTVNENDQADVLVWRKNDLGYSVIINNRHTGLVYQNEIFKELKVGDRLTGYIKKIRKDGKMDVSLTPIGYEHYNDENCRVILDELEKEKGFLSVNDKSSPDQVYSVLGISKKAFKKAAGALYKQKKIEILPGGIRLV